MSELARSWARALTDEVKADAQALWAKCLELYEGEAHLALGYSSWGKYWQAEFGQKKSRGYQMLSAARVVKALSDSTNVERLNESQARELSHVPESGRVEVLRRVEESGPVTARAIREIREEVCPMEEPEVSGRYAAPAYARVVEFVGASLVGTTQAMNLLMAERRSAPVQIEAALALADSREIQEWIDSLADLIGAARKLQKIIRRRA